MKNSTYNLFVFYSSPIVIGLRFIIFFLFIVGILFYYQDITFINILVPIYLIFLINEIFVLLKVMPQQPLQKVSTEGSPIDAMDFRTRKIFQKHRSANLVVKELLKTDKEVIFFIRKLGVQLTMPQQDIDKTAMSDTAKKLVVDIHGNYIRGVDLVAAFILMSENETKYLQAVGLKNTDISFILQWTRHAFGYDVQKKGILFTGDGIFDFFVYGWNYEVKKYALDLTQEVVARRVPPLGIGRSKEFEKISVILSKDTVNNVILVGEPGTGKTTLVEYFAYQSYLGHVPGRAKHKKVFEVLVDRLLAGVNNQGELDTRLGLLISEIAHSGNVVLFIQNIENIFGGGGFAFDMSGVLFQYLQKNNIQIIGTTSVSAYKTVLEKKDMLSQSFETVTLDEPDEKQALIMLFEKTPEIERNYGVSLTYAAVKEAVELSSSYLPDQFLPGKAVNLLTNVVTAAVLQKKSVIDKKDVIDSIEEKTHVVLEEPTVEEKDSLMHLEDDIHKRLIDQEEAVTAIARALRRLRSGFVDHKRPISTFLFLGPTGVGKTETAKALARLYFGSEDAMIRFDMSEFQGDDQMERLVGSSSDTYISNTLVDMVRERPFSLVLLDEFEKADRQILDMFLQVFDDGRLTDSKGRTVSFVNTIIIATSNAGSEFIREKIQQGVAVDILKGQLTEDLLQKGIFKPELLNRFDEVVVFKPLSKEDARAVAKLLMVASLKTLEDDGFMISFSDSVLNKVIEEGYNKEFGARNIRRYIENTIEDYISKQILSGALEKGITIQLTVENGQFTLKSKG